MENNTMSEEKIKGELLKNFPFLENKVMVQRERRIFAETEKDRFFDVLDYAREKLFFSSLCAITGLDEGKFLSCIYHLASDKGVVLNLKISTPRENPLISTVTDRFAVADIYERELVDLLGIKVEGLSEGKRYPLPDNWPEGQYPLRKDFRVEDLDNKEKK